MIREYQNRYFFYMISLIILLLLSFCLTGLTNEITSAVLKIQTSHTSVWQQIAIDDNWKLKSISPRESLDAAILTEAERAEEGDGWLNALKMPAMVHDILLQNEKIPCNFIGRKN